MGDFQLRLVILVCPNLGTNEWQIERLAGLEPPSSGIEVSLNDVTV